MNIGYFIKILVYLHFNKQSKSNCRNLSILRSKIPNILESIFQTIGISKKPKDGERFVMKQKVPFCNLKITFIKVRVNVQLSRERIFIPIKYKRSLRAFDDSFYFC